MLTTRVCNATRRRSAMVLYDGSCVRRRLQRARSFRQGLGGIVFRMRSGLLQPVRFQKAAKLPGENRGLGCEIVIKEIRDFGVQEDYGSCRFIGDHQRHGHDGASAQLGDQQLTIRIEVIHVHRLAPAYGLEHHFSLVLGRKPRKRSANRPSASVACSSPCGVSCQM